MKFNQIKEKLSPLNCTVSFNHRNDISCFYTIEYFEKECRKYSADGSVEIVDLSESSDDDFELFSIDQIFKTGYIVLSDIPTDIKEANIVGYFKECISIPDDIIDINDSDIIKYYRDGITVNIINIKYLCFINTQRVKSGYRVLPYIKNIKDSEAVYITFSTIFNEKNAGRKCNTELKNILNQLHTLGISYKWINSRIEASLPDVCISGGII